MMVAKSKSEQNTVVFYDVDGTLAEPFQSPPANLLKVIKSLDRAGVKQVLCSGKNKEYLSGMARTLGLTATNDIIAENGGIIFDWKKQKVHKTSDDKDKISKIKPEIVKLLRKYKYYEEPKETIITYFMKDVTLAPMVAEMISNETSAQGFEVKHYKDGSIDILSGQSHKGLAVQYYVDKLAPNHAVYTCGDGVNDLEMLAIGRPVTFRGAHSKVIELVKKRGGYLAEKIGPDGLLQAISRLVFNNQLPDTINHMDFIYRDWGSWEVLSMGEDFKVKKMMVNSGARLSLQKHQHRSEHWFIFEGEAKISLNNKEIDLAAGDDYFIPQKGIHRIENVGNSDLIIIEVQRGSYLGEDDIIRYEI